MEDRDQIIIEALAEKVVRLERKVADLTDDVSMWQRIYREKNERISELEKRLVLAGSRPNGSDHD